MERVLDRAVNKGELKGKITVYYEEMKLSPDQIAAKVGKPVSYVLEIIKELEKEKKAE